MERVLADDLEEFERGERVEAVYRYVESPRMWSGDVCVGRTKREGVRQNAIGDLKLAVFVEEFKFSLLIFSEIPVLSVSMVRRSTEVSFLQVVELGDAVGHVACFSRI